MLASTPLPVRDAGGKIRLMPHRNVLIVMLLMLASVGAATVFLVMRPAAHVSPHAVWWLFLILLPVILIVMVLTGRAWAAMVCVAYGTIGLALDLATLVSIVGGQEGSHLMLVLSIASGSANFLLIVFAGRAFWAALQGPRPPEFHPPSPPYL